MFRNLKVVGAAFMTPVAAGLNCCQRRLNLLKLKKKIICALFASLLLITVSPLFAQYGEEEDGGTVLEIKDYLEKALPPQEGRKIVLNPAVGLLTITDTPTNHRLIRELLRLIDVGPKQIIIEAKFVEIGVDNLDESGIEWYWHRKGVAGGKLSGIEIGAASSETDPLYGIHWDGVNKDFPQTVLEGGLDFFISKTTFDGNFISAYLHALEQSKKGNLLSSPKVTTLSGQAANIQITRTLPYVSEVDVENRGTAENEHWVWTFTIEERVTGITLEVTPTVGEGNLITLDIHPNIDVFLGRVSSHEMASPELGYPLIDTRTTQTSLTIRSGRTIILGGLMQDEDKLVNKKIPLLGDIPLLGKLFRYKYRNREKKSLLIFITATLLTPTGEEII